MKDYSKKDENLNKLLITIDKKYSEFNENYNDEESMSNDLLYDATHIMHLQKLAIRDLLIKIKILEDKINLHKEEENE